MFYSPKKIVILHPYLATTAAFFCPQGGRCGEVRLYYHHHHHHHYYYYCYYC